MYNLLLVDDEPAARMAFRDLLPWSNTPYHLCGMVANGQEALAFLRRNPADIIVTDLKMPVMDGLQLIHHLKENGFAGVILVMSNYSDFDLVREALLSGAQDYMLKVNMNRDSLLAQLDCAAQKLDHSPATARATGGQDEADDSYREGMLYHYLLGANQSPSENLEHRLLVNPPYGLFEVRLERGPGQRPLSERSIQSVLGLVFGSLDCLKLPQGEYLCLVPLPEQTAAETACARATQVTRQLRMYLNCLSGVAYIAPICTLAQLQKAYVCANRTVEHFFYLNLPAVCQAEPRPAVEQAKAAALQPELLARQLIESFVAAGSEGLTQQLNAFLAECESQALQPQDVCNCAYQAVQFLVLAHPLQANSLVATRHAALLSCRSGSELKRIALELLPPLLQDTLPAHYSGTNKEVRSAMLYIQYHYMRKLTLEEIAAVVNLDKSYLCRLFKRETGCSVFQYLNEQRMQRAAELIARGNTYVREVAEAVGIEDPFYFTRIFKKAFGVSPSEYKERQVQSPKADSGL